MEDRCVICGDIIPEGRQVCPNCEDKVMRSHTVPTHRKKTLYNRYS